MVLIFFDIMLKDKYKKLGKNKIKWCEFKKIAKIQIFKIFPNYFGNISNEYIHSLLLDKNNHIIFNSIDSQFSISNITSILIYHKTKSKYFNKYYILLLGTHYKCRHVGYGKLFLDEFITWIKQSNNINNKIILKSTNSSINFYISYGFTKTNISYCKLLYKYEPLTEFKNNTNILEFFI